MKEEGHVIVEEKEEVDLYGQGYEDAMKQLKDIFFNNKDGGIG